LFTVVAMTVWGRPAPMAHWRAGPWPTLEDIRVSRELIPSRVAEIMMAG
jgi:hypothetical protein